MFLSFLFPIKENHVMAGFRTTTIALNVTEVEILDIRD